ncbi:hypothetical protein MHU86_20180 [Fragilaria crotonensis]|nr:hypothetical protein MHU86_20180 [Fragilaria crotonensis]
MTNTQTFSGPRSFGKRFVPFMRGSVAGIQPSPLCRSGAKTDEIQQGIAVKHEMIGQGEWAQIPPCPPIPWSEPSLFFCTDQGTRLIRSPPIDLGLHFSSVDHWLLADLDLGLDELADSTLQDDSPRLEAHGLCQPFRETNPSIKPAQTGKMKCRGKDLASLSEAAKRKGKRKRAAAHLGGPNTLVVEDVRSIFQALRGNTQPPAHLNFQIVLSTEGQKISPPSFKFENGLYLLMKPIPKKRRNPATAESTPRVPSELMDFVMLDTPPLNCPWSISGPQFSKPTTIQKRYCYSNGDASYSSHKGATLWTVYRADGMEDFDYRLLHVYHSSKRGSHKSS